jgi:hypothetical protein
VWKKPIFYLMQHGLFFRPKFFVVKLKEILAFDKMNNSNIPVVFITANATEGICKAQSCVLVNHGFAVCPRITACPN